MMRILLSLLMLPLLAVSLRGQAAPRPADPAAEPRSIQAINDDLKFQNGLQFMRMKLTEKAIQELGEYLEIYIHGAHRNEAFRALGDIYFSRMEYLRAVRFYQALYEEYSGSESGVEAYYKIGICYKNMGYDQKALDVFKAITENHSESALARQAQVQLEIMDLLRQ